MIRKGRHYFPEEILPLVDFTEGGRKLTEEEIIQRGSRKKLDGDKINFASLRLQTFAAYGITCISCSLAGQFFVKEKHHQKEPYFHLGLYHVNKSGKWVLMTKDHVIPRSKNGPDCLCNLRPMCQPCNQEKGDRYRRSQGQS